MQRAWRHLGIIATTCALLAGCATLPRDPLPKLTVDTARLEQGPPVLPDTAIAQSLGSFVIDEDLIAPEKLTNYKDLPATVTQIYDATPLDLALRDVVVQTLANDRTIKIQGYSWLVNEFEVPASQGIYDLTATSNLQYQRAEQQVSVAPLSVSRARTWAGQGQLSQLLPWGTTLSLAYNALRAADGVTTYNENGIVGLTQPLLQGFGWFVTNAPIYLARLAALGSAADYEGRVQTQLAQALDTYWDLAGAFKLYEVSEIAYAGALDLVRINRAKFRAELIAEPDLLDAEAGLDSRRITLINAREHIRDLEDQLKRQAFLDHTEPNWPAELRPTQPVGWRDLGINWDQAITRALVMRPEVRRAEADLRQTRVNWRVARNNRLPVLNFFSQWTANGFGTTFSKSFSELTDAEADGYTAGLTFSFPLQNRTARYRFRQAQARVDQSEEALRDTQNQVVKEVRDAARAVETSRQQIDVTRSQVYSEQANLDSQMQRYSVGLAITFEVLQFQTNLANAQARHVQAIVDHNKAVIEFERATGTLLETYGIGTTDEGLKANDSMRTAGQP